MYKKLLVSTFLLFMALCAFSQQLPSKSSTLVTDYTNTLTDSARQQLENKLVAFNGSTSVQIAVVIVKTTGKYDIGDYGLKLGRAWGIGQKSSNNGVLILAAIDDHRVTIKTGFGAEDALPDSVAHQIIENDILPNFKKSDFYGGLNVATDDVMKALQGKYQPENGKRQVMSKADGIGIMVLVFIIIVALAIIISRRGGGGQIIGSRGSASPFWWFLGGTMIGRASVGWDGFSDGSGGFGSVDNNGSNDSSDDNTGDDNSGGDFGGFDGGDFGGGGSDGSW